MQKMDLKAQKEANGGYYWKCRSSYHSSHPGNTFTSAYHWTFNSADSRRAEHVRTYSHATTSNTWVTVHK